MRILNTFLRELTTQSNTALSLGTRLIVLSGLRTRSTRRDLIVLKFCPVELPLKQIFLEFLDQMHGTYFFSLQTIIF